jgi:peptidoglycan hydrolase-like protein with peptidoglycan-binding domain
VTLSSGFIITRILPFFFYLGWQTEFMRNLLTILWPTLISICLAGCQTTKNSTRIIESPVTPVIELPVKGVWDEVGKNPEGKFKTSSLKSSGTPGLSVGKHYFSDLTDKSLCYRALDFTTYRWTLNSAYKNEVRAAQLRGLTDVQCREIVRRASNKTMLRNKSQHSKKGVQPNSGSFSKLELPDCMGKYDPDIWHMCFGKRRLANGTMHIGEWENGKLHGQGSQTYKVIYGWDIKNYSGGFKRGQRDGFGTAIFPHTRWPAPPGGTKKGIWRKGEFKYSLENDPQIIALQKSLKALNFYSGKIDGIDGPVTLNAIRNWQNREGFEKTGKLNRKQFLRLMQAESRLPKEQNPLVKINNPKKSQRPDGVFKHPRDFRHLRNNDKPLEPTLPKVNSEQSSKRIDPKSSRKATIEDQYRVALIIGNGNYSSQQPLKNSINDARLMAKTLKNLGFEVTKKINLTQKQMKRAVSLFSKKLNNREKSTVGLFYYAGHGMGLEGRNYLIPVDAKIDREGDIAIESVDASHILRSMASKSGGIRFMILDACRNNPFYKASRGTTRGLVRMDRHRGSLIAFSTEPGQIALDGVGKYSPYTEALAAEMKKVNPVEKMFRMVRNRVNAKTGGQQLTWEENSLLGEDFFFSRPEKSD